MTRSLWLFLACLAVLLNACEESAPRAVGELVSDRIELTAEAAEPITEILVSEGDHVAAGKVMVIQQDERLQARLAELEANQGRIQALLDEQLAGTREETLAVARVDVEEKEITLGYRQLELERLLALREQELTSLESVDLARLQQETAAAGLRAARARLRELEAGTREEQIEQTRFSLAQVEAQRRQLQIEIDRLSVTAPVTGVVDALPFETGERPALGEVIVVLLSGAQPHARVYIPEPMRVGLLPGSRVNLAVDGLDAILEGRVRWVSSEASFTPYFALTETDRGRLSYVAEIELPELDRRLPDGVPVEVLFDSGETISDD